MSNIDWDSNSESETLDDNPRELTNDEILNITNGLRFAVTHTPIQENIVYIHREKTNRKLKKITIKPSKIPELKKVILQQFYSSIVAPGEAVGVNAAQCIGEPTTQMTLNSVAPSERLLIQEFNGNTLLVSIGDWIDNQIKLNSDKVKFIPENRTEYLELANPVYTPTPASDGTVTWEHITAVTKHLPVGDLIKITTKSGREVTVTASKSLLIWENGKLVQKGGADVNVDDLCPIVCNFPEPRIIQSTLKLRKYIKNNNNLNDIALTQNFGFIVGLYLANGYVNYNSIILNTKFSKIVSTWCNKNNVEYLIENQNNKITIKSVVLTSLFKVWLDQKLPVESFTGNKTFARGILNGYFCSNGNINTTNNCMMVSSRSSDLMIGFGTLCSRFGIMGYQSKHDNDYAFTIYNNFAELWYTKIGLSSSAKKLQLALICKNNINNISKVNDIVLDPIIHIEKVPATEYVYDLTVPSTTNFTIWNGLGVADTFHSAGISAKNVTLGFPRARELFNCTHTPSNPTCTIYFNRDNDTLENLHKVTDKIPEATINDFLTSVKKKSVYKSGWEIFDPEEFIFDYWHVAWFKLNDSQPLSEDEWCLRLHFDIKKLYKHNITIKEIAKNIQTTFSDIRVIPSPLNIGIIDVILNCVEINIIGELSNQLENIEDLYDARRFYMSKIVAPKIRGLVICGIHGISKIYRRKAKCNESFSGFPLKPEIAKNVGEKEQEWIVDTDGTNLSAILALPGVDSYRTISNDMWEIYNILGIEAARAYLFNEFMNIVNSGGVSINSVHIAMLVGKMTYTGTIRAIARFGVETSQYDPITRATFEEVMSQLITSAMFSEIDNLNGISSNNVLGKKINAGTGTVKLQKIPVKVVPTIVNQPADYDIITEEI